MASESSDPRIRFETKEESNDRRQREFMAMTPNERFVWFLNSFYSKLPDAGGPGPEQVEKEKRNFVIQRRNSAI
ncbi:MAG: hypothetical protein WAR83_15020 [Flavobacteriales bacterium]|nr:hypothetical protein [Flavobacteriales bacterium]